MMFKGRDMAERLIATFMFVGFSQVVVQLTAGSAKSISWAVIADVAGFATALSLVTTLLLQAGKLALADPLADLALRAVLTFVQTVAGYAAAAGLVGFISFDWDTAASAAFLAVIPTVLKALSGIANPGTLAASVAVPKGAAAAGRPR